MTALLIDRSMADFEASAAEAAGLLKALANEKRLMILCKLLERGEMSVMPLSIGPVAAPCQDARGEDRRFPPR
jgi:hypothetical protein